MQIRLHPFLTVYRSSEYPTDNESIIYKIFFGQKKHFCKYPCTFKIRPVNI
ncbi:autotransporter outer membrane beta-barrel domain-containing protein, partial [Salmonella enterica]|nr:autotransporter outer membrane beta-barrel domain-containing protein [Salmonella enterica]